MIFRTIIGSFALRAALESGKRADGAYVYIFFWKQVHGDIRVVRSIRGSGRRIEGVKVIFARKLWAKNLDTTVLYDASSGRTRKDEKSAVERIIKITNGSVNLHQETVWFGAVLTCHFAVRRHIARIQPCLCGKIEKKKIICNKTGSKVLWSTPRQCGIVSAEYSAERTFIPFDNTIRTGLPPIFDGK